MRQSHLFRIASVVAALAALLVFAAPAFSQSATGKVVGVITDPSGASVAGATVTATNEATGSVSTTTTNADGRYEIPSVPVGSYKVTVEKEGFDKVVTAASELQINQTLRVDLHLILGSVAQTVAVESEAAQVETENVTIGGTVDGAMVQELPLNGRDSMSLLQTQPGVSGAVGTGTGASIAGGRNDNVSFLLDGGSNNVVRSSGLNFNPNPDAVAEFRVLLNNYTAEYGRSGGGIVSVVTRSGTNSVHGSLFEYVRNTSFNANNFFLNAQSQPRAILHRNQFGGTVGGPVILPKLVHGKDKLFFFFSYQGQRQVATSVGSVATVFTPTQLTGDFSKSANGRPDAGVVKFLNTYPYFQSNPSLAAQGIIDPNRINTVFQNLVKAGLVVSSADGRFIPAVNTVTNYNQYTGKGDYLPTSNDRISATLGYQKNPNIPSGNTNFPLATTSTTEFITLDYTKTIRPTLLNDFRASLNRLVQAQNNPTTATPGPQALGIGITPDLVLGTPQFSLPSGYVSLGYNPNNSNLVDNTYAYSNTTTWIRGRHTFKGGVSFSASQENSNYNYQTMGAFTFSGSGTTIGSGNPLADFFMGLPDTFSQYPSAISNMRQKLFGAFAQDEWKVTRRLQLTLGVRYEYSTPQRDTEGRSFSLLPGVQSTRFVAAPVGAVFPGDPGAPVALYFPDKNNFGPRAGFAWDPRGDGRTSIRGGFGVFYNILNGWAQDENNGVPPYYAGVSFSSNNGNPLPAGSVPPAYMVNPYAANGQPNPFPSHATLSSSDPNLLLKLADLPFGGGNWFVNPHLRTPYIYNYNLSVQRQLARNLALDVSYVGSHGHKLTNMEDANPVVLGTNVRLLNVGRYPWFNDPNRGTTNNGFTVLPNYTTNNGASSYNGLLASLTKRFGDARFIGNTFFTMAYTWSHNIDNGTGSVTSNTGNIPYYNHAALRANSNYDQRQRFTFSGGWELPFAKALTSAPGRLTRGWTLYPIFSMYTGTPFDISAGVSNGSSGNRPGASGAGDNNLVRAALTVSQVPTYDPHQVQTITVGTANRTGLYYFNPNNFTVPSTWNSATYIATPDQRTYGMPRNAIPGIGVVNLDLALAKRTPIVQRGDRSVLDSEFRLEAFNALNHTEFSNPNVSRTSSLFGQVTSVLGNRVLQLALRLTF
jgi:outer membrane receptor protein involved in Fe transport